ncbi:MAG: sugar-transfer associated ATP-grasp domain-containing protein [Hespellia sp.]|nr:sugar-transfer associated ATP-grasp domain-containing protein [Hespellia sp.]
MNKHNFIGARICIHNFAKDLSTRCDKSVSYLERDIIRAKRLNHIALDEYEWIGYYNLDEERKQTVSTLWTRTELRKKYTKRLYKAVLMDKDIFARVYSKYFGRAYVTTKEMTKADFEKLAQGYEKLVYKPFTKGGGSGVKVLRTASAQERDAAYEEITRMKPGVVEQWISQHPEMEKLSPKAVNIIRIYSVNTPAGAYMFSPILTVARKKEIANGCQDALTAVADIRTGKVLTDAVDQGNSETYEKHPQTEIVFKGFQIPYWEEIIEMMKEVVKFTTFISNIGWDIAITPDGPVLIEGNTIPGFNTAQFRGYHELTDGYGYQPIFDEAVKGIPFTNLERYEKVLIKLR